MEEIKKIIEERNAIDNEHQKSWDDELGDYTERMPNRFNELTTEIKTLLVKGADDLPIDLIIEAFTHLGHAPNLVYDDNGNFALSGAGMNPISDKKFDDEVMMQTIVRPEQWHDNIRDAVKHYVGK